MTDTTNNDLAATLAEIKGDVKEIRNIVVGEDGEGGLRRDVRRLTSLHDRGVGMLILLGLLATVFGSVIKEWFDHLIHQGTPK